MDDDTRTLIIEIITQRLIGSGMAEKEITNPTTIRYTAPQLEELREKYMAANEKDGDKLILETVRNAMAGVDRTSKDFPSNKKYCDFIHRCEANAVAVLAIDGIREETIVKVLEKTPSAILAINCIEKLKDESGRARVFKALETATDSITMATFMMMYYGGDLEKYCHHLLPLIRRFAGWGECQQANMTPVLNAFVHDNNDELTNCRVSDGVMLEIVRIFSARGFWANLTFISNVERFSEVVRQTARMALKNMEIPTIHMKITDCRTGKT
ncbi:hypothetical protein KKF81_02730, partial [Candidatus Micrarchaeota archaeon]|nr:hypothetical protein [Candidatus Micrarchaeota archaeon]